MISPCDPYLEAFAQGPAAITSRCMPRPVPTCIARCRRSARLGKKAGVSLNPATPISAIEYVIDMIDLVLVMSVNPGFGGQAFIPSALGKIQDFARDDGGTAD